MQELLKNAESFVAAFFKPIFLKKNCASCVSMSQQCEGACISGKCSD